MHQETPAAANERQSPFNSDGTFSTEKATDLALEHRALGDTEAADALDVLVDFFITSHHYIFNGVMTQESAAGAIAALIGGA